MNDQDHDQQPGQHHRKCELHAEFIVVISRREVDSSVRIVTAKPRMGAGHRLGDVPSLVARPGARAADPRRSKHFADPRRAHDSPGEPTVVCREFGPKVKDTCYTRLMYGAQCIRLVSSNLSYLMERVERNYSSSPVSPLSHHLNSVLPLRVFSSTPHSHSLVFFADENKTIN